MMVTLLPILLLAAASSGGEITTPELDRTAGEADAPAAPEPAAAAPLSMPAGEGPASRQHRGAQPEHRETHELRNPADWPSEPSAPVAPLDAERFDAAVVALCSEVAPTDGLDAVARVVREVSVATHSDPFLMAALAYRQSRCRPGLETTAGIGLLQIEPEMFGPAAELPVPREDLDRERLLDPAHNLRVGAALLAMWQATHAAVDAAVGSTPHRTATAHLVWGDHVWGATAEDRVLLARRRLLQTYTNATDRSAPSYLGLTIISPLTGGNIRLGHQRPGRGSRRRTTRAPRRRRRRRRGRAGARGRRRRRPVRGRGHARHAGHARELSPRQLRRWRYRTMGPGGFFVRIMHDGGVRTGYFHLHTYNVEPGQTVKAGEVIGTVGLTGVKASASHLHFEVHEDGELGDPVRFLSAFVISPERTISHSLAMAEKRERLARARRAARRRLHRTS